ncbi:MAG: 50S ribosomal protein L21 [Planctomycetota bacterium]|jgi:large subunit ribosomal protein L21
MMGETSRATRYAIFEDGGKQYRAEEGALIRVDRKEADHGAEITFDKVLLVGGEGTKVGTPAVSGASVVAVVEAEEKGPKVYGLKRRNHGRSKTRWGHRQKYTLVRVAKIVEG